MAKNVAYILKNLIPIHGVITEIHLIKKLWTDRQTGSFIYIVDIMIIKYVANEKWERESILFFYKNGDGFSLLNFLLPHIYVAI